MSETIAPHENRRSRRALPPPGHDDPFVNGDPSPGETEEMEGEGDVQNVVRELAASAQYYVLRRARPGETDFAHLGRYELSTFDVNTIRDRFGGGRYQVMIYGADTRLKRRLSFTIDAMFQGNDGKPAPSPADAANPAVMLREIMPLLKPQGGEGDKMMERMFAMMIAQQNQMTQIMVAALAPRPAEKLDGGMMPLLVKLIENKARPMSEVAEILSLSRQLSGKDDGDGEGKDAGSGLLGTLAPLAAALLPMLLPKLTGPPALPETRVNPPPRPETPVPPADDFQARAQRLIRRGLEKNSDPGAYAVLLLDECAGPGEEKMLADAFTPETWREGFAGLPAPALEWLAELRTELLELLAPEPGETAPLTPPPAGGTVAA